jgi:hypothetical protein
MKGTVAGLLSVCALIFSVLLPGPALGQQPAPPAAVSPVTKLKIDDIPRRDGECASTDHQTQDRSTALDNRHALVQFLGKRFSADVGRRTHVVAGLVPTTNIAAQAGDLDQTVVVNAFMMENPYWVEERHKRQVHALRINPLRGSCPASP